MVLLNLNDLDKTVENKYWKHITKEVLVSSKSKISKKDVFVKLITEVNNGKYSPSDPECIIVYNKTREKANRISRLVPLFSVKDNVIYYYLLKKIEKDLSVGMHPNAFGAFRNFKRFKTKENINHQHLVDQVLPASVVSTSSYSKYYWLFEWREFMGKSRMIFESNKKFSYFISFDISDFYNSINIRLLENKIRTSVPKGKQKYVNLLIYFIKNWNKSFNQYVTNSKGIPQDEVGDVSRVLANFYLRDFDLDINDYAEKLGGVVLRYSDDFIIYSPNEKIAAKVLYYSSVQLQKIGLNINAAKVHDFESRTNFKLYWNFKLQEKIDKGKVKVAGQQFVKLLKSNCKYKKVTFLLQFLNPFKVDKSRLSNKDYNVICSHLLDDNMISTLNSSQMVHLYSFIHSSNKGNYLRQLYKLVKHNNFNSYHYNLLKAIKKNSDFKKYFDKKKIVVINKRIDDLHKEFLD